MSFLARDRGCFDRRLTVVANPAPIHMRQHLAERRAKAVGWCEVALRR
jgi:hypothetical protein